MQLHNSTDSLTITGKSTQQIEFDVDKENIGLILETLRSKMYSNPIAAICREVASNSRDANRESGNLAPTEIIVQNDSVWTENTPVIIFRDNGPGISPQRMTDVFVKFGASTKRHTNNFTGGFGYGAKTPFAYTDTFYVKTIVSGIEYVYICALDQSRKGKLILLTETPSNEANGTEIIVPLKREDVDTFKKEALFATYFWDVRPIYKGFDVDLVHYKNQVVFEDTQDYYFGIPFANFRGIYALIDGIPYQINDKNFEETSLSYRHSQSLVMLKFPNGALQVSTNRETLIINDFSKKVLDERVAKIISEYRNILENRFAEFEKQNNYHDFLIEYKKIAKNHNVFEVFNQDFKLKKYEYNGDDIFPLSTTFKKLTLQTQYRRRRRQSNNVYHSFRDLVWHNDWHPSQFNFILDDADGNPSRIRTITQTSQNSILVENPETPHMILNDYFKIDQMTDEQYLAFRKKSTDYVISSCYNLKTFIENIRREEKHLKNFHIFCQIYNPSKLSDVTPYKAPRSTPIKKTTLEVNALIIEKKGTYLKQTITVVVEDGTILDRNGNTYSGYVVFADSTNRSFDEVTYYTRRECNGTATFNDNLIILPNYNKRIVKLVSQKYKVLSTHSDFESALLSKDSYLQWYMKDILMDKNIQDILNARSLNYKLNFLNSEEAKLVDGIVATQRASVKCSFVNDKIIKLDWQKYIDEANKSVNEQLQKAQSIIVKAKPFFVINLEKIDDISKKQLEQIKQILLT